MKMIFVLFTALSVSSVFASNVCSDEQVTKNYCATIDWAEEGAGSEDCPIEIDRIRPLGDYKKDLKLEFYSTPVFFNKNGLLYEMTGNYMGGTGIDIVLIDAKTCEVIDQTNVYSE